MKRGDDGSVREARGSFRGFDVHVYRAATGKSWGYRYEGVAEQVKRIGSSSGMLTLESAQRCVLRSVRECFA